MRRRHACFKQHQSTRKTVSKTLFSFFLVDHVDDSSSEQSSEEEERAQQPLEQLDMREHCAGLFDKAAVHLRRAMVLSNSTKNHALKNALKPEVIFVSVCVEFC